MGKDKERSALSELRELGLTTDIDENTAARIKAELLIIDGRLCQGLYHKDRDPGGGFVRDHFYEAYHVIAKATVSSDTPDEVLEDMIPTMVHRFKLKQGWLPLIDFDTFKRWIDGPANEWKGRKLLMELPTSQSVRQPNETAAKAETPGEQIDRLRLECELPVEELAEKVGLDPTNVSRHIRGESNPAHKNRHKYERVFSNLLHRKIVISKTQVKRR